MSSSHMQCHHAYLPCLRTAETRRLSPSMDLIKSPCNSAWAMQAKALADNHEQGNYPANEKAMDLANNNYGRIVGNRGSKDETVARNQCRSAAVDGILTVIDKVSLHVRHKLFTSNPLPYPIYKLQSL